MKFVVSIALLTLAVSGCSRPSQPPESPGVDMTSVTDVTTATVPPASVASPSEPEVEGAGVSEGKNEEGPAPVSLNLALPPKDSDEASDYLFGEKDNAPNYFKSRSDNPGVRLKGKIYMIEEPMVEKRIENLDGGEIGIVVPLK